MSKTTRQPKGGPKTRLEAARIAAGFAGPDGLKRFARRMRRCPRYIRQIELHGNAPDLYAEEAHRVLGCDKTLFLFPNWQRDADPWGHPWPTTSGGESPAKDANLRASANTRIVSTTSLSASPVGAGGRDRGRSRQERRDLKLTGG